MFLSSLWVDDAYLIASLGTDGERRRAGHHFDSKDEKIDIWECCILYRNHDILRPGKTMAIHYWLNPRCYAYLYTVYIYTHTHLHIQNSAQIDQDRKCVPWEGHSQAVRVCNLCFAFKVSFCFVHIFISAIFPMIWETGWNQTRVQTVTRPCHHLNRTTLRRNQVESLLFCLKWINYRAHIYLVNCSDINVSFQSWMQGVPKFPNTRYVSQKC